MILDGIRYSVEIAQVAYKRLFETVMPLNRIAPDVPSTVFASAIADAWTVVDSTHRFSDLVENLHGLPNAPWRRLFAAKVADALELRNCVQHQLGELDGLVENGGQLWGYLSWAEVADGRYTGQWVMLSPGSYFVGDKWFYIGPNVLPFDVPLGRIRLNVFGRQVYMGRMVALMRAAAGELAQVLMNGKLSPQIPATGERRGVDELMSGSVLVMVSQQDE